MTDDCSSSDEGEALWQTYIQGLRPLPKKKTKIRDMASQSELASEAKQQKDCQSFSRPQPSSDIIDRGVQGENYDEKMPSFKETSDRNVARQLKKGTLQVEATLDLHGFTQEEAFKALFRFINLCQLKGKRFLLIITGKGKNLHRQSIDEARPGILKEKVPQWLQQGHFRPNVISISGATRAHGGSGAYYVRLRKEKSGG